MKKRTAGWTSAGACLLILAACGGDAPEPPADAPDIPPAVSDAAAPDEAALTIEQEEIAPELDVDLSAMTRLPSGVYVQDLVEGSGEVVELEDRVAVRYTGWVLSGEVFDATEGDATAVFPLANLIEGWQVGIPGMREGGTRRLVIPYPLAYGERRRSEVIGPRSDLIFEIEVVQVGDPGAEQQGATTGG
ncbi:MAG: FKBP-type peptidyl-prolyl cis-trans isomerase [Gemmatimonadota bacterium]